MKKYKWPAVKGKSLVIQLGFAGILICAIPSCTLFKTPEIREGKEINVRVLRWVGNQPVVRIESHCYNQNRIGFTFQGGELNLYLDTVLMGHAVVDTTFSVEAHSVFMVPIQLQLDAVRLGSTGLDLSKPVKVRVDGTMKGTSHGIHKTMPIHYEGMHTVNLIMNYAVDGQH